jgi:hypothetical protein
VTGSLKPETRNLGCSEVSGVRFQVSIGDLSRAKHALSSVEGTAKGDGANNGFFTGGNGDNRDELENSVSSVLSC